MNEHSYASEWETSDNTEENERIASVDSIFLPSKLIGRANYFERNIKEHNLGHMNGLCSYCAANYFQSETTQ